MSIIVPKENTYKQGELFILDSTSSRDGGIAGVFICSRS